ncbi:MAG: phage holin family protein [Ignavibacteriales bacterium]
MDTGNIENKDIRERGLDFSQIIIRFIAAAIVLAITAFFTPGFAITGIGPLIAAAIVLTVLDYLLNLITGINASPFARGITGFIAAAVIIYATQFFVVGYSVTVLGAVIGAIIFGIVDYLIPGRAL